MEPYKSEIPKSISADIRDSNVEQIKSKICSLLGHRWMYKDYSNYMQENGEKYQFAASRKCIRCKQNAYFIGKWENQDRSKLDFESDTYATEEIVINSVNYN